MRPLKNSMILFLLIVLLFCTSYSSVFAKSLYQWVPDRKVPGYLVDTFTPFLLADQNKTVHAFASQWVDAGNGRHLAVVYRKWTLDGRWTRPIDILLSPTWDAQVLGVFLAPDGAFHLIFWGSATENVNAAIYYSHALAIEAEHASAWSFPELIGEDAILPSSGVINGDDQGNLVVVYNGNNQGSGIYMTRSHNVGQNWSEVTPVSLTKDSKLIPYYIKSYVGASGRVHVVWNVNVSEGGVYDSLYYAGIDIKTGNWIKPLLLDKRPDVLGYFGPSVPSVVDNGKYVVILYNGGNPFPGGEVPVGRPTLLVRLSEDGGETWGDVTIPFPFLTGQSGEQALVVDSNQVIHAIANMRIDSLIEGKPRPVGGVWHSEFKDGIWRFPQRFVSSIPVVDIRAVVSQGNVILATWTEDPIFGHDGVWYSFTLLDSPALPVTPLPIPPVLVETPTIMNTVTSNESTLLPTDVPEGLWGEESDNAVSPQLPFLVGVIPAVILIGVILIRAMYVRRK